MLDQRYGLKYSMPHSVVHIVDNSMYTGELPTVVVDDPSIYATIVVTGAPMGTDNEIVTINRSDVLNVAYGMSSITASDIDKYGQTVTYPSDLLDQDVPIKMLRVTPEGSTYAFSCLLIQWHEEGQMIHVRYKTTEDNGNNGLPVGSIHASYKNAKRLHNAFVNKIPKSVVDENGTTWEQRVFMTFIAAGRGAVYNNFRYAINQVQQSKRPANVKYLFSTIDSRTDLVNEKFFASLINDNNSARTDSIDSVNTMVGKRVKGSSILIPTLNESAVRDLYAVYMSKLKESIENKIEPPTGETVEYVNRVYKIMNINIFDPIFGRYIYNGDTDVKLPFLSIDMFDLDIPKLGLSNRIPVVLHDYDSSLDDASTAAAIAGWQTEAVSHPKALYNILNKHTYGITNADDTYHVGNIYLSSKDMLSLTLTTTINQFTGSVTNIPISRVYTDLSNKKENATDLFRAVVEINPTYNSSDAESNLIVKRNAIAAEVKNLIATGKIRPRINTDTSNLQEYAYLPDYIIYIDKSAPNSTIGVPTIGIAKVPYEIKPPVNNTTPIANRIEIFSKKSEIYPILVYPTTTVTSFATSVDIATPTGVYYNKLGSTFIDIDGSVGDAGEVYVNGYDISDVDTGVTSDHIRYAVNEDKPFVFCQPPTSVSVQTDFNGSLYDIMMYYDKSITWYLSDINGSLTKHSSTDAVNYVVNNVYDVDGIPGCTVKIDNLKYDSTGNISSGTASLYKQGASTSKITSGEYEITGDNGVYIPVTSIPEFVSGTYYKLEDTSYVVMSTEPADWATNYANYYTAKYTRATSVTPTWVSDTYYSESGGVYTVTSSEPADWNTTYTDYYTRSYNQVAETSAPTWVADTYYSKSGDVYTLTTTEPIDWATNYNDYYTASYNAVTSVAPTWVDGTYFSESDGVYTVVVSEPADWATTYTNYYTRSFEGVSATIPTWTADTYYSKSPESYEAVTTEPADWRTTYTDYYEKTFVQVQGTTAPTFVSGTYYKLEDTSYVVMSTEPDDWETNYANYYTAKYTPVTGTFAPIWNRDKYYKKIGGEYTVLDIEPADWDTSYSNYYTFPIARGLFITINDDNINVNVPTDINPVYIQRYGISGPVGSLYNYGMDTTNVPNDYYSPAYGENPTSELGGIAINHGYAGFFDDVNKNNIIYKWKYSELLVKAYKGMIDPRIMSPVRCSAKYLFDGGTNTIVGQTILPYIEYKAHDIIYASTIFTDDEKETVRLDESIVKELGNYDTSVGIDVKQAMYDLMEYRCYYGIPEDKRPIGYGSGLSLHLDSGITDATTAMLLNTSFIKRFNNPNASWDIGGFTYVNDGVTYTYAKRLVAGMFRHMKTYTVNKPYTGKYTTIGADAYSSFFPDIDTTDWEMRELLYNSGGNAWIMDVNGNLQRKSQRTLYREGDTSDLIQENNMRTLSQIVYMLQNKIDSYLLEYNDDGVLKTLKDEVDNMFTNWVGNLVQALDIQFERDINPFDGGEIVVCYCNVTFRGLILRVPIIVNVQRRHTSE